MSLLLDALHRASKDKEKIASGAQSAGPVANPSPPLELSLGDVPSVQAPAFPTLDLDPEPVLMTAQSSRAVPPLEMTLEFEPVTEKRVVTPGPSLEVKTPTPDLTIEIHTSPPLELSATDKPMTPVTPGPMDPSRIAKDIRRAYAKDPPSLAKAQRRTWVLGGVALVLALSGASIFMGVPSSQPLLPPTPTEVVQTPLTSAEPIVASQVTTPTEQPVVESGRTVPVAAVKPDQPTAPAKAPEPLIAKKSGPRSPRTNEVVLRGDANLGKPDFEVQLRGPTALEGAYDALLAGRWDAATRLYEQALKVNSEERDALLGLAYIAQTQGQGDRAGNYYRRVLRQEPSNALANAGLLSLESNTGSSVSSAKARDLAARQPDSAASLAVAGDALAKDGLLAEAGQMFAQAHKLDPTNPRHIFNHAVALDRLGQYRLASAQYESAIRMAEKLAPTDLRTFDVDAARQRYTQLQQAFGATSNP
jgi:Tfp pilus assembly protein PilF